MRRRDRTGLALAPVFLRLGLAVVFIWAGLGKFMARMDVQGEQAAILANYGVITNPHAPAPAPKAAPETAPETPGTPGGDGAGQDGSDQGESGGDSGGQAGADAWGAVHLASQQSQPRAPATAADFPEPVSVRVWTGVLLTLHEAIHPGLSPEDSSALMALWPDFDKSNPYSPSTRYTALAVALTELVGGILIAVGLLTRLGALGVAGVMVGAMWLTGVGPAVQSGHTVLGFLPDHKPFDGAAWSMLLQQFMLGCAAIALFFAGPGTLSLDRLLLGGPEKGAAPKPAPAPAAKK